MSCSMMSHLIFIILAVMSGQKLQNPEQILYLTWRPNMAASLQVLLLMQRQILLSKKQHNSYWFVSFSWIFSLNFIQLMSSSVFSIPLHTNRNVTQWAFKKSFSISFFFFCHLIDDFSRLDWLFKLWLMRVFFLWVNKSMSWLTVSALIISAIRKKLLQKKKKIHFLNFFFFGNVCIYLF